MKHFPPPKERVQYEINPMAYVIPLGLAIWCALEVVARIVVRMAI